MQQMLEEVEERFAELDLMLGDPEIIRDQKRLRKIAKEHADLGKIVDRYRKLKRLKAEIEENRNLLSEKDDEIKKLAKQEITYLTQEMERIERELKNSLAPKNPNDERNVFLEIRGGTGGDEAGLFAADMFRMYGKFAEMNGWKVDILSRNFTGVGGFKEIIALIEGDKVYSKLKFESGVHRVQRIPETESQGRIHTSTVTVAVLPEADEIELAIDPDDLRIDVFRSSGPGGQSVNTTDSAVRITHIPTGLVVTCQDEKSQHKNKAKAMKVLRAKLLDKLEMEQQREISQKRRSLVGSGDRSERIRTYNFPQGRVTDHRIGLTLYKLDEILEGHIKELIDSLNSYYQAEALRGQKPER
ncbi:MAG: peptide chain release factor 1 [Syntrophobacterales bacterium]|nr:MAG: peptide chain release factor 1 [Syntrophobacterales bacterium]